MWACHMDVLCSMCLILDSLLAVAELVGDYRPVFEIKLKLMSKDKWLQSAVSC